MAPSQKSVLRFLRAVFWEDWLLKIFCLILATLYWFYIDGELTDERELSVTIPVSELQPPEGARFPAQMRWPQLHVRIRGPRRKLQYLTHENVRVHLKEAFSRLGTGDQVVTLTPDLFEVEGADGLGVVSVRPDELPVRLSKIVRKTLPVKPDWRGKQPPDYEVETRVEPMEVTVEALQDLETAAFVLTEPIELSGKTKDFTVEVGIAQEVQAGEQSIPVWSAQKIKIEVLFRASQITKELADVPVAYLAPPGAAMTGTPKSVTVVARGRPDDLAELTKSQVRIYAEWPAEWDLRRPPGEVYPEQSVQVKVVGPPRVTVLGPGGGALPTVKVRGMLTGSLGDK
ncbi:MAG: hypothetical protein HS116_08485 [Planctomycetes bacterium]|nr:hypothetical protein [Planctomycetota bacterium]